MGLRRKVGCRRALPTFFNGGPTAPKLEESWETTEHGERTLPEGRGVKRNLGCRRERELGSTSGERTWAQSESGTHQDERSWGSRTQHADWGNGPAVLSQKTDSPIASISQRALHIHPRPCRSELRKPIWNPAKFHLDVLVAVLPQQVADADLRDALRGARPYVNPGNWESRPTASPKVYLEVDWQVAGEQGPLLAED